jgi:alkylated DNA repair dioxygenase AlkB
VFIEIGSTNTVIHFKKTWNRVSNPLLKKTKLIDGLVLLNDFITLEEEATLIGHIDKQPWDTRFSRRTQHYGYFYDYISREAKTVTEPIPEWMNFIIDRLLEKKLLSVCPDQVIINEYKPGRGIVAHTDAVKIFEDGIVSLSLLSQVNMTFAKKKKSFELPLPRCSALCLHREARYRWTHAIANGKKDGDKERERRVSITFRKMK